MVKNPQAYRRFDGDLYGLYGTKMYMKTKKEAEANKKKALAHGKRRYGGKTKVRTIKLKQGYVTYAHYSKYTQGYYKSYGKKKKR